MQARVVIPCSSDEATLLQRTLSLDADDGPEGTATRLTKVESGLEIALEAQDVSGLRAALNSVLRLLDAAWRVTNNP